MAGQKPFWILTSSFASARFQHFWVRRGQALAFSAKTWNLFLLDRSPESPTSSKIPPKSASIHYLQRNDQDTHGFRSPKSVTRVKLSQKDACSPFQPSYGACRIESRRIHAEACSRADCIPVRKFVFGETCGRLPS